MTSMGRLVHDIQGEELARTDFVVLVRLAALAEETGAVRSRDLARSEGLDPSTMSRRLASLTERGLVEREPDPQDGRAWLLSLSPAGRDALARERARRVAMVTDALGDWSEGDRAELARLLAQLTDTLEARRAARGGRGRS